MGGGDVKLLAVLALYLGWAELFLTLLAGCPGPQGMPAGGAPGPPGEGMGVPRRPAGGGAVQEAAQNNRFQAGN